MPDKEKILGHLETEKLGRQLVCLKRVDSTNTYLFGHTDVYENGAAVTADVQTAGLGRRGRKWSSYAGRDISLSFLLKGLETKGLELLPLVCGLSAVRALKSLCTGEFGLKWPNDVLLQGKKICGILCSSKISGKGAVAVCGTGVNVSQDESFFRDIPCAASISMLEGRAPEREEIIAALLNEAEKALLKLRRYGLERTVSEYSQFCVTLGKKVTVHSGTGTFEGTADHICTDGALLIKTVGGETCVHAGDVTIRTESGYA